MSDAGTTATVPVLPPCDICRTAGVTSTAAFDGKTTAGPWANMCTECMERFGIGLGVGRGQRLILREESASEEERPALKWVTVLASGGNTVYLFDARDKELIDQMEMVLDVAYPAVDTARHVIASYRLEAVRAACIEEGMEIVDHTVKETATNEGNAPE